MLLRALCCLLVGRYMHSDRRRDRRALVEHFRLCLDQLIVERLEVKPADEVVADMLAAISCALLRNDLWFYSGGFD